MGSHAEIEDFFDEFPEKSDLKGFPFQKIEVFCLFSQKHTEKFVYFCCHAPHGACGLKLTHRGGAGLSPRVTPHTGRVD